jgi:integrating conjugative element protein (TIGR03761 family)
MQTKETENRQGSTGASNAHWQLTLHTKPARYLFVGDWKKRFGLQQFAASMKRVCQAAQADDPYAYVVTLNVQEQIAHIDEEQTQTMRELQAMRERLEQRGLRVTLPGCDKPWVTQLQFATPFAYQAACVLGDFDRLVRWSLAFKPMVVGEEAALCQRYREIKRQSMMLYSLPRQWRHTGITRADLLQRNAKAQRVATLLGELPEIFLKSDPR